MSESRPPSFETGAINPYQPPTAAGGGEAVAEETELPLDTGPLRFWEGRKALLKSLFYMRCFTIVTALLTLRAIFAMLSSFQGSDFDDGQSYGQFILSSPLMLLDFLIILVNAGVTLYLSYVVWQYAKRLQEVAGMHRRDPTALCQEHLWCWRLKVLIIALVLVREGTSYLVDRSIIESMRSP